MEMFLVRLKKDADMDGFQQNFRAGCVYKAECPDSNCYYIKDCLFFEEELVVLRELPA